MFRLWAYNEDNHYCAFVPHKNVLYQLGKVCAYLYLLIDGRLKGPVMIGKQA